jgi:NTE family protein
MRRILSKSLISLSLLLAAVTPALAENSNQATKPGQSLGRPRIGLALGGGGARGAAHVSVLRGLEKAGIPIDCIAGTSIGSVVGGLYSAGVPLDTIEEHFKDGHLMGSFMTVPLWVRVVVSPIMVLPRAFGSHPYDGLYKGNKFRKFLTKDVPSAEHNIEDLKIPYSAVAVSLVDGKPHRLSKGSLGYAMQASCAVPGLRKPVEIDGDVFCDGGISANVPVEQCRAMGADIVIAVCIDERMEPVPIDTFRKIGSVSERLIKLQLHDVDAPQLAKADIVIHPNVDGISLISTKKSDAATGLKAGEEAVAAALPAIKKLLSDKGIGLAGVSNPN